MTLKTFWPKCGIIRHNVKRFWWVSAMYAFILFLCEPYMHLCNKEQLLDNAVRFPDMKPQILANNEITFVLLIGAAVLLGICVFRYMQSTRSATLFHALPITRGQLYMSALASGFVLLLVPVLLNSIILAFMCLFGGFEPIMSLTQVADWAFSQLLTGTATLCFTVFVGVFTGNSVAQLVYVFAISFVPLGVVGLLSDLLDGWLFGFTSVAMNPTIEFLLKLVPMYYPQYLTAEPIWWIPILAGVYILLFTGLGLFFYHKRPVERAGDVVAFSWVRPVFLYGVTFCVMLLGTSFFTDISGWSGQIPNVFVFLLFALIGYAAAKMLILKSFRIARYYKGYVVFGVLVLLAYFAISSNAFGFGTTVPEAETIEKVYVGDFLLAQWDERDASEGTGSEGGAILQDEAGINMVRDFHQDRIDAGKLTGADRLGTQKLYVAYQLTSGRKIVRAYGGPGTALHPIFDTDASKDSMFPNFRLHPEGISHIRVIAPNKTNEPLYGDKKEELIACIRADLDRLSYEEISDRYAYQREAAEASAKGIEMAVDKMVNHYSMEVGLIKDNDRLPTIWFQFNENFTETVNWLRENRYLE